jgi:hypothetical protein
LASLLKKEAGTPCRELTASWKRSVDNDDGVAHRGPSREIDQDGRFAIDHKNEFQNFENRRVDLLPLAVGDLV